MGHLASETQGVQDTVAGDSALSSLALVGLPGSLGERLSQCP